MEQALPNLSLITHFEWSLPYKDYVCSKSLPSGFLPLQGQNKQRLCSVLTPIKMTSHTRDKNWVNECQCRQFLTKLQKNNLQDVKRATSRLQVRLTHLWLVPDPSTSPSGFYHNSRQRCFNFKNDIANTTIISLYVSPGCREHRAEAETLQRSSVADS